MTIEPLFELGLSLDRAMSTYDKIASESYRIEIALPDGDIPREAADLLMRQPVEHLLEQYPPGEYRFFTSESWINHQRFGSGERIFCAEVTITKAKHEETSK